MNSTFAYNGLDTRVTKNAQSFLRDGAYVTDPVLRDGQASFTPGISERRGATTTFQHSGLKNADAQSSIAQTLTATKEYDAFGNLASSSGTWQGPFGYAGGFGYQTESDSGLMLLGHRYMDPSTGRFLTRDPVKDGRNWYGYVGNNPVAVADSSGLWWKDEPNPFWKWLGDVVDSIPKPVKTWSWAIEKLESFLDGSDAGKKYGYGGGTIGSEGLASSAGGQGIIRKFPPSPVPGEVVRGHVGTMEAFINTVNEPGNGVQAFVGAFTWTATYDGEQWDVKGSNTTGGNSLFYHILEKLGIPDWRGGPMGVTKQTFEWTVH